jgi:phosphorylcholine metabolism protein LicD
MSFSRTENFDQLFPDVRETGETQLRQCQLVMLRMLKIFDYLCRKHNIQYFLTGGTLLGAVRHKGFIPWDDDLDVGMKRKEYEKFIKLAAHELPNDVFFQNRSTDRFYPLFHQAEAKLRDKYSRYFRTPELEKKFKWHNGIQVDIFVYDCAFFPSNHWIYLLNRMFLRYFKRFKKQDLRGAVLQFIEKYIPLPFVFASGFIERKSLVKTGANFIRKHELKEYEQMRFEDMQAWVPAAWKVLLHRQYGDYMQLPPEEQRVGMHSIQVADPFTPCNHNEVLRWENRKEEQLNTANKPTP